MKTIITIILLISVLVFNAQEVRIDSFITNDISLSKAGSCGSPDGATLEIASPPSSYQFLEDNGYCNYTFSTTSTFTSCYTMVAPSSSVSFNAGSSTTCNNRNFSNFKLYNSSCTLIGTGLTYTTLTAGQTYTWCIDSKANGGGSCNGFDSFCPYYMDNEVLPIVLTWMRITCDAMYWSTASETNNDYFLIESSQDGETWDFVQKVTGGGTSATYRYYFKKIHSVGNLYYRLVQVDYDGKSTISDILYVECDEEIEYEYYNILGQKVPADYVGYKIRR